MSISPLVIPKSSMPESRSHTKDQRVFVKEQLGYEGGLTNPMSWDRTVEKFHWLSEPFADEDLRSRLIETVQQLDSSADLGPDGPARPGSTDRGLSGNSPRHSVSLQVVAFLPQETNVAGFRPSSRNPHKSVSDMQFNQVVSRARHQQLDIKIN